MDPDQQPQEDTDWKAIGYLLGGGFINALIQTSPTKPLVQSHVESKGAEIGLFFKLLEETALQAGKGLHLVEEPFFPIIAAFVAPIISGLFGADVPESTFTQRMSGGAGAPGAKSIVEGFLRAIQGEAGAEITPSMEPATRLAAAAVQAEMESEFNAQVPQILSHLLPFDMGHFTELTKLPEAIIGVLGVSRLVRGALRPLVNASCTVPMTWHVNKLHRHTLLGAGEVARQVARGRWTIDQAKEELARDGYSDERIEALLNAAAKFLSAADLGRLVRAQQLDPGEAIAQLQEAGYDEATARVVMTLEQLAFIEKLDNAMADAAVTAYADGRIDEGTLGGFCSGTTITPQHKAQLVELAHARRICNAKPLTPSEAAAAVEAGVLSFDDYRHALERDNRTDDAITVLELLLRAKLDATKDAKQHKAELAAEKAKAAADKIAAALAKKAEHDQVVAQQRRGKAGDLETAAIRGLIPIARVAEVYARDFDDETAGILVGLLEQKRQDYLAQQAARAAAVAKAATRGADVGQIEASVRAGVLTVDEFRARLVELRFTPADADLLARTLAAELRQRAAAQQLHDAAAAAAKIKHVDLGTLELLVRRGHRSLGDFDRTLRDLGFDDAARAALAERLQIEIADDAAAAKVRANAAAKLAAKGLSLEQYRRAVIIGARTIDQFQTFLVSERFTPDAITALVAELRTDVSEADAARQRRADAAAHASALDAPLGDVAKAARLGVVPVALYVNRLRHDHYTDDAIAIEQDLLVAEIADLQAARAKRAAAEAKASARGLSLAQIARAVKFGQASVAEYVGAARATGLSDDDADLLGRLLQAELDVAAATAARRKAAEAKANAHGLSLTQIERAVKLGQATVAEYVAAARASGLSDGDAELLGSVLQAELDVAAATAARKQALAEQQPTRELARADVAKGVIDALQTLDDYAAWLTGHGYAPEDVDLLVAELQMQLDAKAAKAAGQSGG